MCSVWVHTGNEGKNETFHRSEKVVVKLGSTRMENFKNQSQVCVEIGENMENQHSRSLLDSSLTTSSFRI